MDISEEIGRENDQRNLCTFRFYAKQSRTEVTLKFGFMMAKILSQLRLRQKIMAKNKIVTAPIICALNETLLIFAYFINFGDRTLILLVLIVLNINRRYVP